MAALTRDTLSLAWKSWFSNDLDPRGPAWLQWVLTGVFSLVIALCFTVLGFALNALDGGHAWASPRHWLLWYGTNLTVSAVIAYLIHVMFAVSIPVLGTARIRGWSDAKRSAFFAGVPIAGVMIGWPIGVALAEGGTPSWMSRLDPSMMVGVVLFSVLISFIFHQVFSARQRQVVAERRAVEAQLKLLQAQMEPHFLFNTLANVLTLIDAEPQRAKRMLESFTDYLRATLAGMRQSEASLGSELDLAEAYLRLLQLRMEDRLRFEIDGGAGVRAAALPPLMLQPLVENAIHHGLEPKLDGGTLAIRASVQGGVLQLTVSDDGLGPDAPRRRSTGNGIALDNLRQRLQALYGDAASLTIEPLQPGTRATLRLPLTLPSPAATDAAATPCPLP